MSRRKFIQEICLGGIEGTYNLAVEDLVDVMLAKEIFEFNYMGIFTSRRDAGSLNI